MDWSTRNLLRDWSDLFNITLMVKIRFGSGRTPHCILAWTQVFPKLEHPIHSIRVKNGILARKRFCNKSPRASACLIRWKRTRDLGRWLYSKKKTRTRAWTVYNQNIAKVHVLCIFPGQRNPIECPLNKGFGIRVYCRPLYSFLGAIAKVRWSPVKRTSLIRFRKGGGGGRGHKNHTLGFELSFVHPLVW